MSSFWSTSDGGSATDNVEKEYDSGGGSFELIPDKTNVLMHAHNIKWDEDRDGNRFISIQWAVDGPPAYLNRRVFHKIWAADDKPGHKDPKAYRDKQLKMLATIDAICGGKLAKAGREPNDDDLAIAINPNKQMVGKVGVWSMPDRDRPGENIEGNWVMALGPKNGNLEVSTDKVPPARSTGGGGSNTAGRKAGFADDLDDDIPFAVNDCIW